MKTVAYLGQLGSYSHSTAMLYFSDAANFKGYESFKSIFQAINSREVDYAVLPVENSLAGSIYENYDLLDTSNVQIIGEYYLPVDNTLLVSLSCKTTSLKNLRKIYSHPKALEQCSMFFNKHPWIKAIPYSDTANAAKYVGKQKDATIAAIASKHTAELYNLKILKEDMQDQSVNYTRFLVAGTKPNSDKNNNKCSLIVRLPHIPGSLHKLLGVLVDNQCNLMKIESRPMPERPFEYIFYLDFCYEAKRNEIDQVISDIHDKTAELKVLGFYKNRANSIADNSS